MSELEFFEVSGPDGRLRIAVDDGSDEPPYMQSPLKYRPAGSPLARIATAIVFASNPERDGLGLYWPDKAAVGKALDAARKAAKGR